MNFFIPSMILILIARSMAFPGIDDNKVKDRVDRQRRVTCDLLGFMGDSACAANCLSMGKAGGTCSGGICRCRSDTLGDVIENRFGPGPPMDLSTNPSPLDPATWLERRRNKGL